jgi:hypothetical protein
MDKKKEINLENLHNQITTGVGIILLYMTFLFAILFVLIVEISNAS